MVFHETQAASDFRPGFLPHFFTEAVRRLGLSGRESLLDIGCGWGDVALGFAPHVGSVTGLDPERQSLDLLERRARDLGLGVRLVQSTVETADEDLGRFDLITVGRALWYMEAAPTLLRLARWLKPDGRVLVCSADERKRGGEAWAKVLFLLIARWARGPKLPSPDWTPEAFFAGSSFVPCDTIDVYAEQPIDLEHMVKRFFAYPQTSYAMLGEDAIRAESEVRTMMGRFFRNGPIKEALNTRGVVFKARRDA